MPAHCLFCGLLDFCGLGISIVTVTNFIYNKTFLFHDSESETLSEDNEKRAQYPHLQKEDLPASFSSSSFTIQG